MLLCVFLCVISISQSFSPLLRISLTSYHTQIKDSQIHACLPSSAWFLRRIGQEPACHSLTKAFLTRTPQRLMEYLVWSPWIKAVSQKFDLLLFHAVMYEDEITISVGLFQYQKASFKTKVELFLDIPVVVTFMWRSFAHNLFEKSLDVAVQVWLHNHLS